MRTEFYWPHALLGALAALMPRPAELGIAAGFVGYEIGRDKAAVRKVEGLTEFGAGYAGAKFIRAVWS